MPTSAKIFTVCGASGVLLAALAAALILQNQQVTRLYHDGVPRNAQVVETRDRLLRPDLPSGKKGRYWAVLEIPGPVGSWRHDAPLTSYQYRNLEIGGVTPVLVAADESDKVYVGTFAEAHADMTHVRWVAAAAGVCGLACAAVGFVVWLLASPQEAPREMTADHNLDDGRPSWELA